MGKHDWFQKCQHKRVFEPLEAPRPNPAEGASKGSKTIVVGLSGTRSVFIGSQVVKKPKNLTISIICFIFKPIKSPQ